MNVQDIAALLQKEGSGRTPDEHDDVPESANEQQRRTELLAGVLSACKEAQASKPEELEAIAERLGDGSRDVAWRIPFGEAGILEFFLDVIKDDDLDPKLQIHILRFIGNSCADTDENRARVVEGKHLPTLIHCLENETLIPLAIPVLFNIMVDYEPAQLLASQSLLNKQLITLLSAPNLPNYVALVPYFCKILALLISQECEPALADPLTPNVLLTLAMAEPSKDDIDDSMTLVSVAAAYLADESYQARMVSDSDMELFMDAFYHMHAGFDLDKVDDEESITQMKQLRTSLLNALADLSGNEAFTTTHSIDSPIGQSLLVWLQGTNTLLQAAACLALGNMSRSDEASMAFVQTHKVHLPLIKILSNPAISDPQVIHSALSFLKNLAIPAQNKPELGGLLEPDCVPRIYTLDTLPQVQFGVISMTRLLLLNTPANVRRICAPVGSESDDERTSVDGIISLFNRSDAEPTKLEAARCIAAICRVLHSTPVADVLPTTDSSLDGDGESKQRELFYKKHSIEAPLAFLVTQPKWPILRSEAWFVFALMSRSKDGASLVFRILDMPGASAALSEAITGDKPPTESQDASTTNNRQIEDVSVPSASADADADADANVSAALDGLQLEPQQVEPAQATNMAKADRENALVLCTQLVRGYKGEMSAEKYAALQGLVRKGGEAVAAQRAQS